MKLQILIPQYKADEKMIKLLLDSIAIQQNISMNDIGLIICNDGSNVILNQDFLNSYPFQIEYHLEEHGGICVTRNKCLRYATAPYVMFCDEDDMFYTVYSLSIIFESLQEHPCDILICDFVEEIPDRQDWNKPYKIFFHQNDELFIHGKIYNRQFLITNNILWDEELYISEDFYFNNLCRTLTKNIHFCPQYLYLWKAYKESVTHNSEFYYLEAYDGFISACEHLIEELKRRKLDYYIKLYLILAIDHSHFEFTAPEASEQRLQYYYQRNLKLFKNFYYKYKDLWQTVTQDDYNDFNNHRPVPDDPIHFHAIQQWLFNI